MKRRNTVLLSIALFGTLLILPSFVAAHSQGLHWGVKVGDRYDYTMVYDYETDWQTEHLSEEFYVVVDELPQIPDPYRYAYPELLPITAHLFHFYANETKVRNFPGYVAFNMAGNWSIYEEELNHISCSFREVFETSTTWGYHIIIELSIRTQESYTEYHKETGVLIRNVMDYYNTTGYNFYHREMTLNGFVYHEPIIAGLTVTGIVLIPTIVAVVWIRRRK